MKKLPAIFALTVFFLSSCNITLPQQPPGLPVNEEAATIVALTLTGLALPEENFPLASPSAQAGPIVETTNPPASTSVPASTNQTNATATAGAGTPSATILTVDSNTNCREGPGQSYAVSIILVSDEIYQIIARSQDNLYWVITPPGSTTVCWVLAEFSNAFGDVSLLPVITPSAPTSVAGPITAPTGLKYNFNCAFNAPQTNYTITVVLSWADRSNNEQGFYLYRNGALIASLLPNSTGYTDIFLGGALQLNTYQVAAYNAQGQAVSKSESFTCIS